MSMRDNGTKQSDVLGRPTFPGSLDNERVEAVIQLAAGWCIEEETAAAMLQSGAVAVVFSSADDKRLSPV